MKKILVVDDDKEILKVVEIILGLEGYDVRCVDNGDIFPVVLDYHPDIILLDIVLGGCDGRNICRQLKAGAATCGIPIIIISATGSIYDQGENSCGAEAFIPKPFNINFLISQVDAFIN